MQLFLHLLLYTSFLQKFGSYAILIAHHAGPGPEIVLSSHEVSHLDSLHVSFLHFFLSSLHFFLHALFMHALLHFWKEFEHSYLHSSRVWHGGGGKDGDEDGDEDGGDDFA